MDTLTADMLAEALQEPKKSLLAKVLKTIGQERCQALFTEACTLEASGGMLTADGTRRREGDHDGDSKDCPAGNSGGLSCSVSCSACCGGPRTRSWSNATRQCWSGS
ncbi:MAG TPA: phosphorylated adapter RNA export RNA-binding domain-containing protein [Candidatus Tectomicrobia bacterium]